MVYDLADRPGYVVKLLVARKADRGKSNLYEATVWKKAPDDLRKWLVPVEDYDPAGQWLIMRKGERINADDRPRHCPTSLHDWRKVDNWVRLDGKVLLCDYGQRYILRSLRICLDV